MAGLTKRPLRATGPLRSDGHTRCGLGLLLREEANAQIHPAATALIILAGWAMLLSADEWRWLIAACAAVWSAEAVNTAVERLCDRVCPDHDPLIGATKDLAAGAVLLTSGCALTIGATVFLPHLTGALR